MHPRSIMKLGLGLLVPFTVVCLACAPAAPPRAQDAATTSAATPAAAPTGTSAPAFCDLVCEQARVVRRAEDDADYHARATANANEVLQSMQSDLLACYKQRVAANPSAHGFITTDIVIGPDGRVLKVETTGGAVLGPATISCITHRIEKAVFAPPHGGGTLRIHVPFSLRKVAAGEDA